MKKKIRISFIGGDTRQRDAILIFADEGFSVKAFGFNNIVHENVKLYTELEAKLFDCDLLMLPVPYNDKEGNINIQEITKAVSLESVLSNIKLGTLIILGKVDSRFSVEAAKYDLCYYDLLAEESFSILNAIPTAEGAVQRAMERTDITIHGSNVLVLGYGRLGKVLANVLKGLGANVTVEARRNEDLAWIRQYSYNAVHLDELDNILYMQDIIFNTIPYLILDRKRLSKLKKNCVIIDLASYPGGCDYDAVKDFGINANLDLSLPGKVAPKTAADIICHVTKEIANRHFHYDIMGG